MYVSSLLLWSIQFSSVTSQKLMVNETDIFVCTPFLNRLFHCKDPQNHQLLRDKNNLVQHPA